MSTFHKVEKDIQKMGLVEMPAVQRVTMKLKTAEQLIVVPHARVYALPLKANTATCKQHFVIVPQDDDLDQPIVENGD